MSLSSLFCLSTKCLKDVFMDTKITILLDCAGLYYVNFVELETVFKEANIMVQASIITKSPKNLESSETTTVSPGSSSLFKMVRGKCHIDQ